jgi:NAD(P)H dehydrogenase (quinone)
MTSEPKVLVTGATGTHGGVGGHLVNALIQSGVAVRALARVDDERTNRLRKVGAEIAIGDFQKLTTLRPALLGIEHVFFCYPLAEGLLQATANLCVAAREASVRTMVNMSIMMAAEDHPSPICRDHWLSERLLDWAGVGAIHLRGGFFYENLIRFAAAGIAKENRIILPFGDGEARLAWVGAADIAAVAASILAHPEPHHGKTYEVTGSAPLTIREIADLMSKTLDRPITYAAAPLDDWLERIAPVIGGNTQLRRHVTVLARAFGSGPVIGRTNNLVRQFTGRPAQEFPHFVASHASSFLS